MFKKIKTFLSSHKIIFLLIIVVILIISVSIFFIISNKNNQPVPLLSRNITSNNIDTVETNNLTNEIQEHQIENSTIDSSNDSQNAVTNGMHVPNTLTENKSNNKKTNTSNSSLATNVNNHGASTSTNNNNHNSNINNNTNADANDNTNVNNNLEENLTENTPPITNTPKDENEENSQLASSELFIAKSNYDTEVQQIENWYNSEVGKIQQEINSTYSKMNSLGGSATYSDVQQAIKNLQLEKQKVAQAGLSNSGVGQASIKAKENELSNVRIRHSCTITINELNTKKDNLYSQKLNKLNTALSNYTQTLNEIKAKYNL